MSASARLASFAAAVLLAFGAAAAQGAPDPEQLFGAVEASLGELPHDRFYVAAVVEQVRGAIGPDGDLAAALFAWVRDETGLSPYRGVLKGPTGVLMDRSGNSLDRALLLRELLLAAGEQAVLATAQLDAAALTQVAAAVRPAPADASAADAADGVALAQRLADEFGADAAGAAHRVAQAEEARRELLERLLARADSQSAALADALAPALTSADPSVLLTDHWWVQVQRGGAWVDLDPTLPGAAPGDTLTPATARFGPATLAQLAAVGGSCADLSCGERLHSVVVSAHAERWDGSELSESELFSVELLPAELIGRAIAFVASPEEWPEDLDLFGIAEPTAALRDALLATSSWRPVLLVGDQQHGQKTLKDDGTVSEPSGGGAGALGGGIGGMFGGFGGGGGSSSGGELTALWLEFELRTPGTPTRFERRAVFDLLGPAARAQGVNSYEADDTARLARAAALAGDVQLTIFPATLHPAVVSARAASRLLVGRTAWTELYWSGATADPSFLLERQNDTNVLVAPLESYELLRARAAVSHGGAAAAPTSLGVAAFHRALDLELRPYSSFDLVFGSLSGTGGTAELASGVLDANVEALLQEQYARQMTGGASSGSTSSTTVTAVADAFAADLAAGRAWRLVDSQAALDGAAPGLPADIRQSVLDALGRGKLAVVPTAGEEAVGFWSFDPVTGSVMAIGDRGWGQAMTEYDVVTNIVLQLRTVINQYASMAQCLGIALTMPLRGESGVTEELAECVFNLVCGQVNTAINTLMVTETNWTNVILSATIDALWGGAPETGFGGFCGGLWSRISGG